MAAVVRAIPKVTTSVNFSCFMGTFSVLIPVLNSVFRLHFKFYLNIFYDLVLGLWPQCIPMLTVNLVRYHQLCDLLLE